jgi:hypothetical protein
MFSNDQLTKVTFLIQRYAQDSRSGKVQTMGKVEGMAQRRIDALRKLFLQQSLQRHLLKVIAVAKQVVLFIHDHKIGRFIQQVYFDNFFLLFLLEERDYPQDKIKDTVEEFKDDVDNFLDNVRGELDNLVEEHFEEDEHFYGEKSIFLE